MENAAPAARRDLERFFEELVPETAEYEHDAEGADDSTSHIRMVLSERRPEPTGSDYSPTTVTISRRR